jgi:hypothetical protein
MSVMTSDVTKQREGVLVEPCNRVSEKEILSLPRKSLPEEIRRDIASALPGVLPKALDLSEG